MILNIKKVYSGICLVILGCLDFRHSYILSYCDNLFKFQEEVIVCLEVKAHFPLHNLYP